MKKLIMFLFLPVYIYSQCPGDTNEDGTVDIIDIVQLVDIILNNDTFMINNISEIDFNNDNIINIIDVIILVQIILN